MANKGNKRHTKRFNTPGFVKIPRKHYKFFINSKPGPHPKRFSLPLGHVLRDLLKIARNNREVRYILNNKYIRVDGKVRTDPRLPIGLMDVVEIDNINKRYRIIPSGMHTLTLSEITKDEAMFKLCKIENIKNIKGGNIQLNLHDGRNIVLNVSNPNESPEYEYTTNGTLKISIPEQEILDYFPFEEGNEAIVFKGTNIGYSGKLSKLTKRFGVRASIAEIGDVSTAYDYIFMIGKDTPSIDLPIESN